MTDSVGVTISNFVSEVLVAGVAIVVISGIVVSQISGTNSGIDNSAIQELESKINNVCNGEQDDAPGEISMSSGTTIVLEEDMLSVEGVDPDDFEGQTQMSVDCSIESRTVLENTELYTVTSSGRSYAIR